MVLIGNLIKLLLKNCNFGFILCIFRKVCLYFGIWDGACQFWRLVDFILYLGSNLCWDSWVESSLYFHLCRTNASGKALSLGILLVFLAVLSVCFDAILQDLFHSNFLFYSSWTVRKRWDRFRSSLLLFSCFVLRFDLSYTCLVLSVLWFVLSRFLTLHSFLQFELVLWLIDIEIVRSERWVDSVAIYGLRLIKSLGLSPFIALSFLRTNLADFALRGLHIL